MEAPSTSNPEEGVKKKKKLENQNSSGTSKNIFLLDDWDGDTGTLSNPTTMLTEERIDKIHTRVLIMET